MTDLNTRWTNDYQIVPSDIDHRIAVLKALVGSHNYNLNTESSDKDYKYFVLPTLDDLYDGTIFSASKGAFLPKGIYAVGGAGSEQRYTYYDSINDCIVCGCWDDYNGNHLESFKKRIEDVYGLDAKSPNPKHYKAYQAAIHYFEACRDAYMSEY